MPKMPKLDDWNAPWELDENGNVLAEEEQQLDPVKLKKYLHGLLTDKERLQTTVTEVTTKRDELQGQIDEQARKGESDVERLQRELREANERADKAGQTSIETLKLRVALRKGLSEVQAKRLVGTTEDELEADADELVESFGGNGKEGEGEPAPRRQPKRLSNSGDPEPDSDPEVDVDKVLENEIPRLGGL